MSILQAELGCVGGMKSSESVNKRESVEDGETELSSQAKRVNVAN